MFEREALLSRALPRFQRKSILGTEIYEGFWQKHAFLDQKFDFPGFWTFGGPESTKTTNF
jgi:hypothetical protein